MKMTIQNSTHSNKIKTFILFAFEHRKQTKEKGNTKNKLKKNEKTNFIEQEIKNSSFSKSLKLSPSVNSNFEKHFIEVVKNGTFTGKKGEIILYRQVESILGKNILYVGLGDQKHAHFETYRQAAGKAYCFLKKSNLFHPVSFLIYSGNLTFSPFEKSNKKNLENSNKENLFQNKSKDFIFSHIIQALAEGFCISNYSFDQHKNQTENKDVIKNENLNKKNRAHEKSKFKNSKNKESKKQIKEAWISFDEKDIHSILNKDSKESFSSNLSKAEKSRAEGIKNRFSKNKAQKTKELSIRKNSKTKSSGIKTTDIQSVVHSALKKAQILSESVHFVRRVSDTPGNLMTPDLLSKEVLKAAQGIQNLNIRIWNKEKIKKEKMGGLYGVSLGSTVEPRFIIMEYKGGSPSKKPVCFVGKGLTFDSGGISIKPSQSMHEMKYDMCGGATVIGSLLAIAKLRLKVNVLGLVPSSENMPGPMANKPGDILVARNGKSVEVLNTDAEGRLILMDALSYASEKSPQVIFDAATLTGAIVVALGNIYTGVFTRKDELWDKIASASQITGERFWRLPLDDFHVSDMRGTHADLSNISSNRGAGSSTAAAFLEAFVKKDIPWAHFDIAGTAWSTGNRLSYCPNFGASGSALRTFVALAEEYASMEKK